MSAGDAEAQFRCGIIDTMDVLSSRTLLRSRDPQATQEFYRDVLELGIYREYGGGDHHGVIFFLGNGLLEVSGTRDGRHPSTLTLWIQVRDVEHEVARLASRGVPVLREARAEFWGLIEAWIEDPDGTKIVLVQVPDDHPLRRDQR